MEIHPQRKQKFITLLALCCLGIASQSAALEVNFNELGKQKKLTPDAVNLFKQVLPEAEVLSLSIVMIEEEKTAVMITLFNKKNKDGFNIMRRIPNINSYTYMVAWLLQGHFYFLKEEATTPRQKKHLQFLSQYFQGRSINGSDTFYLGEFIELFYEPLVPKIRGINLSGSKIDTVLFSGYPKASGFGKIIMPGFKIKYIAVFSRQLKTYNLGKK
ncbi:MAG: hypothetical protein GY699_17670 [Desulfobacteraceae bacterium]|nr:hypothetical protein [Desulfobacteraceae bacterium]